MTSDNLLQLPQAQRDRLAYLELRLRFAGEVCRQDLTERFGIQTAAATRDLTLYREVAGNNIDYDRSEKIYKPGKSFIPLFHFPAERVLSWLAEGFGDGDPTTTSPGIPCITPGRLTQPDLDTLAVITRAIYQKCPVRVDYHSISSGKTRREIAPFALIDTGLRWHVRGFDRKRQEFRDFVITRIQKPEILMTSAIESHEKPDQDIQWTRIVEVELVPHPDQPYPEISAMDYGMKDGVLRLQLRAATAGYILRKWSVDCSPDHSLRGHEYRLWLRDHLALYGVKNALLAPGYRPPTSVSAD